MLEPAKVGKTLLNLGLRGKMFHVERLFDCVLNSDPPLEVAFEFRFCIIPDPLECSTWNTLKPVPRPNCQSAWVQESRENVLSRIS